MLKEILFFLSSCFWKESRIPKAMGNIIAVVAVLLIQRVRNTLVSPSANSILDFLPAILLKERTEEANL